MNIGPRILDFDKFEGREIINLPDQVEFYTKLWSPAKFYFRQLARQALKLNPNAINIADIGTGPGFLAVQLAKLSGKKVKAVDLAPNMLKKADELAQKQGVEIETIKADCKNLPFADNSLDIVTSSNLIHMLEDPLPFFRELKRVVKPGGKALITGFRRDAGIIVRKLADFNTNVMFKNKPLPGMAVVLKASFTKEELDSLLDQAGLTSYCIKQGVVALKLFVDF